MTTAAMLSPVAEPAASSPRDVVPFNSALPWPLNVPNLTEAHRALFEGSDVATRLAAPTMKLLGQLSPDARALFELDPRLPGVKPFKAALASLWRVEVSLAIHSPAARRDAQALQAMLEEVAKTRGSLEAVLREQPPELAELVAASEQVLGLLLERWDAVLNLTTAPLEIVPAAPRARRPSGESLAVRRAAVEAAARNASKSGLHPAFVPAEEKKPERSELEKNVIALALALVAAVALAIAFNSSDSDGFDGGGAPEGWVLAGDPHVGLATLMPANPNDVDESPIVGMLDGFARQGFSVQRSAAHEFTIASSQFAVLTR